MCQNTFLLISAPRAPSLLDSAAVLKLPAELLPYSHFSLILTKTLLSGQFLMLGHVSFFPRLNHSWWHSFLLLELLFLFLFRYFPLQATDPSQVFIPGIPALTFSTSSEAIVVHKSIPCSYRSKILPPFSVLFGAGCHGHTADTFPFKGSKMLKEGCLKITWFCEKCKNVKDIVTISVVGTRVSWWMTEYSGCYHISI